MPRGAVEAIAEARGWPSESAPSFQVSTGAVAGPLALDVYRQVTSELFHCKPAGDASPDDFSIDLTAWHLGSVLMCLARCTALNFERSRNVASASGVDHLMIQLYMEGGFDGLAGGVPIAVRSGDICVFDLMGTLSTEASDFRSLTILIPRAFFESEMEDVYSLHGLVMARDQALTELLANHLLALVERLPRLRGREAEAAARATVALFATVLADLAPRTDHSCSAPINSPFRAIARYIDQRLHDTSLEPGAIAEAFNMSRARLYRLFDPVGGVCDYIRRRRLTMAALELAGPNAGAVRIGDVAYRWGFASDATFSRSFRDLFGVRPSEARHHADRVWAAHSGGDVSAPTDREFSFWMKSLSH